MEPSQHHTLSESSRHDAGVVSDHAEQKYNSQYIQPSAGRNLPRKPSPLQVSDTASPSSSSNSPGSMRSPKTPPALIRSTTSDSHDSPHSPPSPRTTISPDLEQSQSPRDRLHEFIPSEHSATNGDTFGEEGKDLRDMTASPSKAQSYSQLRKLSSPILDNRPLGNSSPPSPRSAASPPLIGSTLNSQVRQMPRTSSIDSAISSISFGISHSHKGSLESVNSGPPDISNLIKVAGSAEVVIQHLLKDKQQLDTRNAQLWTLIHKQRALLLNLRQDLDKAAKDKERYRKKLREYQNSIPPVPSTTPNSILSPARAPSQASERSETSAELPIQKQSVDPSRTADPQVDVPGTKPAPRDRSDKSGKLNPRTTPEGMEGKDTGRKNTGRGVGSKHSHKQTSSSDIGVFGATKPTQIVPPLRTRDLDSTPQKLGNSSSPLSGKAVSSPTSSFTAKRRSQGQSAKPFNGPVLALSEALPSGNDQEKMTPPRKAPPAPLDLAQPKRESPRQRQASSEDDSDSDYEEHVMELPISERGRKKTRADDDREREAALIKEQEARSRSKKKKDSKSRSESKTKKAKTQESGNHLPTQKVMRALAPESAPGPASSFLSAPNSLAGMLSPSSATLNASDTENTSDITERSITIKPLSPGLPLSPRPSHRPMNPPTPRMPRDGATASVAYPPTSPKHALIGLPLSPRAPRQPIPFPPQTPMSMAPSSPMPPSMDSRDDPTPLGRGVADRTKDTGWSQEALIDPQISRPKGIFKGFMSESYPGLLIPPNALPSIKITVVSSRLKPSRNSLVLKGADDEPVFTLGVSARYDQRELWLVEKPILSLQQLDLQLRQSTAFNVKLPDRSLFSGHAPARIDARRIALEKYFESVLDTQMDEKAAVSLCHYLSTNVSEPSAPHPNGTVPAPQTGSPDASDRKITKSGYLTKRGKNFGGWKARYFVLSEPVLRYFEAPGGALLGTINLHSAQIGKQAPARPSGSPQRSDEGDGQYRHAFLIRQPKKKDSSSFMDHVLCAESDAERDAWVTALLCYVEVFEGDDKSKSFANKSESGPSRSTNHLKKKPVRETAAKSDSPQSDDFDTLQAVPYEDTRAGQAPSVRITPDARPAAEGPSTPTTPGRMTIAQAKTISGPHNGAKISDVGAWGNKPMASPLPNAKEQKKRGLWGFHNKDASNLGAHHPNDSDLSLTQLQYQEQITNVKAAFGAPLAEAVECCAPQGVDDVCLPAVVYRCLEYLRAKHAAGEEGIFRMSGSNILIKKLKGRFNAEGDCDLLAEGRYYDVHAVASLLKLYLRELPSMLLTRELHMQFLSVLELKDDAQKVAAYNAYVHELPTANYHLLRALSEYLITVVNNADVNLMNVRNVCIVFSPTLNIPTPVFTMFLANFDAIFGKRAENVSIPILEVTQSEPLTPEDIRSPRRQIFSDLPTPSYSQDAFPTNQQKPNQGSAKMDAQMSQDLGFTPLQPAYENSMTTSYDQTQGPSAGTVPGPEYAVARPRNLAPGGPAKARRRESSMLMMGIGGQRTSSLPMLGADQGMQPEKQTR